MAKIISVFNQKGGIGKSTVTINLGAALGKMNMKVLLVDLDPQASTTVGVGIDDEALDETIYNLLGDNQLSKEKVEKIKISTEYNVDLIPSNIELSNAEISLSSAVSRETLLKKVLKTIEDDYDYILIDCPPSLGLLSLNALAASNGIIVPIVTNYFSMKGIKHLVNTYDLVKNNLKEDLQIVGILVNIYDKRKKMSHELKDNLKDIFGDKVFNTAIRVNAEIEKAQDNSTPIINFNENCNGYKDYMKFSKEVLDYEWK